MIHLFPKSALLNGGFRPDVLQAIRDLTPATIRDPGGCFASAYRWKDGIGPRDNRTYFPNVIWDDQDPNQMGTDEFMDLCQRVGAEPILPVNMNLGVQEALDWLEYCNGDASTKWGGERAKNGHPAPYQVKLWEIDNETWGMGPEPYAEVVTKFSRALRAKDPSLKIIACGGYGYDDGKGSSNGWNSKLLAKCAKDFDYLSIHYYNGIMYEQDFVEDPRRYEAYMRDDIGKMIKDSANPAIRIYCSEWGMMNDEWRSGLYTGGILNGFERQSELVPMTCPAVWLQTVSASRPRPRWTSCLILFDHKTCYGAPTWVVEKLWREHYAPKRVRLEGPEQPLNSVATLSADGKKLYLKSVNPTKQAVTVELTEPAAFAKGRSELLVVSGRENDRNTLAEPARLAPQARTVTREAGVLRFTMPALSAGVLTVSVK
jgi:alpha-N-arabinofuranosidase